MTRQRFRGDAQSPATRITQEIVARLEAGTKPWIKPWRGVPVSRPLRACGTPYRGMNVFWLWMVADMCGYASSYWMTYSQAQKLGAQVRKGEKACTGKTHVRNPRREGVLTRRSDDGYGR